MAMGFAAAEVATGSDLASCHLTKRQLFCCRRSTDNRKQFALSSAGSWFSKPPVQLHERQWRWGRGPA